MRRLLPLLPILLGACATDRLFAPRENVNGAGPTGRPAAVYPLSPAGNGEVRLWSDGGDRRVDAAAALTVLHVGFELENTGNEPLVLDPVDVRIADLVVDEGVLAGAPPRLLGAPSKVATPNGSTARVDLEFGIDGELMPRAIRGFHVHWRVQVGVDSYAQVTPFQTYYPEDSERVDPWPWWGFGYGYYWRRH